MLEEQIKPPTHLYTNPAMRPVIQWEHFPKDMTFEEYHERAAAFGMALNEPRGRLLFDAAKRGGKGMIVEIGSYWLLSACYMAAGSKTVGGEKIISIDVDKGDQSALYSTCFYERPPVQIFRAHINMIMMGLQDWIIPMRCSSEEAALMLDIDVRLLHIDGGHSWPDPAYDLQSFAPKMIPGGMVVFHDTDLDAIARTIDEYVRNSDKWRDFTVIDDMTAYAVKK